MIPAMPSESDYSNTEATLHPESELGPAQTAYWEQTPLSWSARSLSQQPISLP
ncbi:hypothetical protein RHGRI_009479 [Rhododendron griersonianum]|uniref:Uncharacterized protein n=1 Tax=Rhododendron griersonianum TaxID=479676 RepID=A0AAV6KEX3_9ERIC|nr:hypothetical protein RHGRI_009479 [Rhododendron griersonianum]